MDDSQFDEYAATERFVEIQKVSEMEAFLLRAARRFHSLERERLLTENSDSLTEAKEKAWEFLYCQFTPSTSDLRMFFTETADFHGQSLQERKRLIAVADLLVGSGTDESRIEKAQELRPVVI